MFDLENLALWAAQDALKSALRTTVEPLGVTVDLGHPDTVQPEHVWISGDAEGTAEYMESGNAPSNEQFVLTVHILCTYAAVDYADTRARLKQILAAVTAGLSSASFVPDAVDQARASRWQVDEGRNGEGHRQIGLSLEITCDKWSG